MQSRTNQVGYQHNWLTTMIIIGTNQHLLPLLCLALFSTIASSAFAMSSASAAASKKAIQVTIYSDIAWPVGCRFLGFSS